MTDRLSTPAVEASFAWADFVDDDIYLCVSILLCVSFEVTVTSLHPPRLCRIAVFSVNLMPLRNKHHHLARAFCGFHQQTAHLPGLLQSELHDTRTHAQTNK